MVKGVFIIDRYLLPFSSITFHTEHLAIILPRYNFCHQAPTTCVREIASVD